jgi:hypothetical protein
MKTILTGIVLIIGGIWVRVHYTPYANLCRSPIGGFAQAFSGTARQNCGAVETAVTLAPWAIGIGVVILVGSILLVLGVLGSGVAGSRKRRTGA